MRERRQQLDVLLPSGAIVVDADAARLLQVFVNLINNAAKFTPPGGHIWVKGGIKGDEAVVHAKDDGIGIAHGMLRRIFELFTQVESSRVQCRGGLGIGLPGHGIVTLHGESVQVSSTGAGKGSKFRCGFRARRRKHPMRSVTRALNSLPVPQPIAGPSAALQ